LVFHAVGVDAVYFQRRKADVVSELFAERKTRSAPLRLTAEAIHFQRYQANIVSELLAERELLNFAH
jgi:hypothetical protein